MKKNFLLILICLFALISCASQKPDNSEADLANEYADEARREIDDPRYADMAKDEAIDDGEGSDLSDDSNDYIERFVNIDLETISYDKDLESIKKSVAKLEGFVEIESTYFNRTNEDRDLRNTELTIKIPKESAEKFDQTLEGLGKTINVSKNSNNLEKSFRDADKDLEIKEKQLEKFNELLENSNNIEDTLVINAKIIETQGEIDNLKKAKADLKDRVTYDTYNVGINEVYSYNRNSNNPDLGSRIKEAMGDSIGLVKEFFAQVIVGFFLYWPFIIIILALGFGLYKLRKKFKSKK
ncbi:DUF4349 domain-containing protein [uncultured Anaerococcus sp.]|uniref:DUF4349 domain-containing protein n=1 Tax=uncultured Anaerococcus sp. TaxID=293428 RepID=UPI002889F3C1|nr:DUF4349 domain-containing protein [uncultured Anaerococcus sp.]